MAELDTVEPNGAGCCSPAAQESCCEPEAKSDCCGDAHDDGCGCTAEQRMEAEIGSEDVREVVRERYAAAAVAASAGTSTACCGNAAGITDEQRDVFGAELYEGEEREALPEAAQLASLGCGNPTAVADLHEGETVLDLGSAGRDRRPALRAPGRPDR